jgi:hypothetical protein
VGQEKEYNPTSASKAIGALKRAFNWAVEEEHLPRNLIAHVRKPKSLVRDRTLTQRNGRSSSPRSRTPRSAGSSTLVPHRWTHHTIPAECHMAWLET